MVDPQVVVLITVGGGVVGILVGRYSIRQGQKEQLADDVKASDPIRAHIKGIATSVADQRIEAAADKNKWLDDRDNKAINVRFDTLETRFDLFEKKVDEQFAEVKYSLENGLAARIAKQVMDLFEDPEGTVYEGESGPRVTIRKTRKRERKP